MIYAIAKRELMSLFYSPIAYMVLGLFGLGTSMFFLRGYGPGWPATLRDTFFMVIWLMIFLVPAISMRLLADEYRHGTIESLMTAPVADAQVVIGKWFGAMAFFTVLLSPLLVFVIILTATSRPDFGPIITGFVGLLLVGGMYLAIGAFASAATQNQIIAFLLTVFIICMLTFAMFFLPRTAWGGDAMRPIYYHLDVNQQFDNFNKGLIDLSSVVYFVSGIGLFLFLAVVVLQSRRWR